MTIDLLKEHRFFAQWGRYPERSVTYDHKRRIERKFVAEIERRGGETLIVGKYNDTRLGLVDWRRLGPERRTLYLLTAHGWRKYGCRHPARPARLAYLCGSDDNGLWAARVPGTLESAEDALEWLTPKEVSNARVEGRRVLRQGDVYVVETKRDRAEETADLIDGHTWCPTSRILLHDGGTHRPLKVPFRCKLIQQRAYHMGRGAWTEAGD